ncbi:MAG: hypothetical protein V2A63_01575 [Patescibacteria group bacterium]
MGKFSAKLRKIGAGLLVIALFALQLPSFAVAAKLAIGRDSLGNSAISATSSHSISFITQSNLIAGDSIELRFPDFGMSFTDTGDIIVPVGPDSSIGYSNTDKKITLTLTENFPAGAVEVAIASGALTNPTTEGQYSISIATKNSAGAALDQGSTSVEIANQVQVLANIIPVISNVTSSVENGDYWIDDTVPIEITFSGNVFVEGTPTLDLNNGASATYDSGSGTNILTFNYEIGTSEEATKADTDLDYASVSALNLDQGDSISLANGRAANLTLPEPGAAGSLAANKNIQVRAAGGSSTDPTPVILSFQIVDNDGSTSNSTPVLKFSFLNSAYMVSLSCDNKKWNDWQIIPDSWQIDNFNILGCNTEEGLKKVWARVISRSGDLSLVVSDSTVYTAPIITTPIAPIKKPEETIIPVDTATKIVNLNDAIKQTQQTTKPDEAKIIEVGYINPKTNTWKSFTDYTVDQNGNANIKTTNTEQANNVEVHVVPVKKLEGQTSAVVTVNPVLAPSSGKVPVNVTLASDTSKASAEISAGTTITRGGGGYNQVVYAPEVVENPPAIETKSDVEVTNAFFVGSSSGSIQFDQPVKLTLPTEKKQDPQMRFFDEEKNEWVETIDSKTGKVGGEISADGETISAWVDHMTLFAVVGVKKVKLAGISQIEIGGNEEKRAEFESGEWFSSADIDHDDRVSFVWSGVGEKFYYTLDKNPLANSLNEVDDQTKFTTDFFVDNIKISEGESYFHIRAAGAGGERGSEIVFVVDYDKTPPRLTKIKTEPDKLELYFSEEVMSNDALEIYFADGQTLEIPALTSPTAIIEIAFEGTPPEIISIVGLLIDHAGLVLINPSPAVSEIAGAITAANVAVLFPAQIANGKYLTRKDFVQVEPQAIGATAMRLANQDWEDFAQKEITVPLPDFGSQKILFDFKNDENAMKSAGVVVARIPANADESATLAQKQDAQLAVWKNAATQRAAALAVWGISKDEQATLALANPAILPTSDLPDKKEIDNLKTALKLAREIRAFAKADEPKFAKILERTQQLDKLNFTLDEFLSVDELGDLFAKMKLHDGEQLAQFLNFNSVTLRQTEKSITVGALTLGLRDSDRDGLSDLLELTIGTDPFRADSDQDGRSDSLEFLKLGSSANKNDLPKTLGFTNLPKILGDPRPFLTGIATANAQVTIVAVNTDGAEIALAATPTDSRGAFAVLAEAALPAGNYEFQIRENDNVVVKQNVTVNLDFILTPPKIFANNSEIFDGNRVAFYGNTFYGARVIAFFDGQPSEIVADNTIGDFVVRPPRELAVGTHRLTIFAELADGTRSPARVIDFSTAKPKMKPAALVAEFDLEKTALAGMILLLAGITAVWIFRRRNQVNP